MNLLYLIIFFVLGLFMGSFYTVVGFRAAQGQNYIKGRSHCDVCGHELSFLDMIPIISYIFVKQSFQLYLLGWNSLQEYYFL